MSASLEAVLRLVAEGKISPDEADRILAAFESERSDEPRDHDSGPPPRADRGRPHYIRIEVTENGRPAVNLRLPTSLGELAMARIPGLASGELDRIREAVRTGLAGPIILTQDEDGSGVRISIE